MIALSAMALALQATGDGREPLGIYQSWGAFRETSPLRCYAIAEPVRAGQSGRPFVSIANWPQTGVRAQLHVRLSRARRDNAAVTLAIGERRFTLVAGATDAWAADPRTDAAIVAAMRGARSMSVESVGAGGVAFADLYALGGAATAIDAAGLGCTRR